MKLIYIINIILFILMTLNQIIFEHIDDKYAYGKYGDFKVIMMTKNRYINATKLCKEYSKDFFNWKQNKNNQELINEVEIDIYSADNKSIILINGGRNQIITGSYVHPLLMDNIIDWIRKPCNIYNEYNIVLKLNDKLNGQLEVVTQCGKIDIVTNTEIIEVKEYKLWKHALGQILVYGYYYPNKNKRIHLFNCKNNNMNIINTIYTIHNVILSYE